MVGLRALMLAAMAASLGCTGLANRAHSSIDAITHTVQSTVGAPAPEPVVEFDCVWMNRPQMLADPGRDYVMKPGLVGQAFFFDRNYHCTTPLGDLTISVSDATKRPPGMPPKDTEVFHFTGEVLRKLIVDDERYGLSVALFLPWPEEWKDVTMLTIQARYDQKDVPNAISPLMGRLTSLTMDFANVDGASAGGMLPIKQKKYIPVPDPHAALNMQNPAKPVSRAWAEPAPAPPVQQVAAPVPQVPMSPDGEFRSVIPRR